MQILPSQDIDTDKSVAWLRMPAGRAVSACLSLAMCLWTLSYTFLGTRVQGLALIAGRDGGAGSLVGPCAGTHRCMEASIMGTRSQEKAVCVGGSWAQQGSL